MTSPNLPLLTKLLTNICYFRPPLILLIDSNILIISSISTFQPELLSVLFLPVSGTCSTPGPQVRPEITRMMNRNNSFYDKQPVKDGRYCHIEKEESCDILLQLRAAWTTIKLSADQRWQIEQFSFLYGKDHLPSQSARVSSKTFLLPYIDISTQRKRLKEFLFWIYASWKISSREASVYFLRFVSSRSQLHRLSHFYLIWFFLFYLILLP